MTHIISFDFRYMRPTWVGWQDDSGNLSHEKLHFEHADTATCERIWNAIQYSNWQCEEYYYMTGDSCCDVGSFFSACEEGLTPDEMRRILFHRGEYTGSIFVSGGIMYQSIVQQYVIGDNIITYEPLVPFVEASINMDDIPF